MCLQILPPHPPTARERMSTLAVGLGVSGVYLIMYSLDKTVDAVGVFLIGCLFLTAGITMAIMKDAT